MARVCRGPCWTRLNEVRPNLVPCGHRMDEKRLLGYRTQRLWGGRLCLQTLRERSGGSRGESDEVPGESDEVP